MKEEIIDEIMKECKDWKERLLVRLFPDIFEKAYHAGRISGVNYILKK